MTDDLESRLRASLHAEADTADHALSGHSGHSADHSRNGGGDDFTSGDSLATIRTKVRTVRRRRNTLAALGAVAVVVVSLAGISRLANDDHRSDLNTVDRPPTGSTVPRTDDVTPSTTPTSTPTSTTVTTTFSGTTTQVTQPAENADPDILGDGFQPLWPFATRADADAWLADSATSGSQPWHADPEQTALSFTQGYLGFTDIDEIVGTSDVRQTEAWVSVGYATENGSQATAAVVHLMRYGDSDVAPWEVVGTRDDDLQLERPDYGTTARSPMTVGGYITGVDESLRVTVRQPSSEAPLGESCCLPAGGTDSPWETTVEFSGASDPALTVVVSTGGHVQDVERFAITGLRS